MLFQWIQTSLRRLLRSIFLRRRDALASQRSQLFSVLLVTCLIISSLLFATEHSQYHESSHTLTYHCHHRSGHHSVTFQELVLRIHEEHHLQLLQQDPKQFPDELFHANYSLTEDEADRMYLGCDIDQKRLHRNAKRLAIVRPFIYKNIGSLLQNIGYWEMDEIFPCTLLPSIDSEMQIDLVFWFHRSLDCNPSIIKAIEAMFQNITRYNSNHLDPFSNKILIAIKDS